MSRQRTWLWLTILVLAVLNGIVFSVIYVQNSSKVLAVTFLNVGQGDSILIEAPSGKQMLVDGGPDRSVLRELPKVIGPLDRTLDLVVETHPDKDHIAGLIDVFDRYQVGAFLSPGIPNDTSYTTSLVRASESEPGVVRVEARRGMRIHLGDGAYADVLYPDRDVDEVETNTGSVILQVVYGDTEFMLTGDAPTNVERWLVSLDGDALQSDVLKAGHHGSRTSTDETWLQKVSPSYVVISAGLNNSYGHPHTEVVESIQSFGATLLSTTNGSVRFITDGKSLQVTK